MSKSEMFKSDRTIYSEKSDMFKSDVFKLAVRSGTSDMFKYNILTSDMFNLDIYSGKLEKLDLGPVEQS